MSPGNDNQSVATAVAQPLVEASSPQSGGASLDKVRDILFGAQMREYERRLTRLEERLVKDTADLKEDVRKRLEALDSYVKRESESLAQRITVERNDRTDSHETLARDLRTTAASFDKRTAQIDEQLATSQRDLRQQILDQHQHLSDDIRTRMDELLAILTREAQELRNDKADRATIASLLTEMALRLTNDLRVPVAEDVGDA